MTWETWKQIHPHSINFKFFIHSKALEIDYCLQYSEQKINISKQYKTALSNDSIFNIKKPDIKEKLFEWPQ